MLYDLLHFVSAETVFVAGFVVIIAGAIFSGCSND